MPSFPPETVLNQRYVIQRRLGAGGAGVVYQVFDRHAPESPRALKILNFPETAAGNDDLIDLFKNEFRLLATLDHPSIARVFDFGLIKNHLNLENLKDPLFFFTSELIEGKPLFEATKNADLPTIIDIVMQICRTLEFLAERNIVHRDLKSGNILVSLSGSRPLVKILDFGIAMGRGEGFQYLMAGTIPYTAPEILEGKVCDTRADLFSLGIIFYRLLTGGFPYDARGLSELQRQQHVHLGRMGERMPQHLPPQPQQILIRLLERNPRDRFFSGNQVIMELESFSTNHLPLPTEISEPAPRFTTDFVGRQHQIVQFKTFYENASRDHRSTPSVCVFIGEPGSGKSTLLLQVKNILQLDHRKVHLTRIPPENLGVESFRNLVDELRFEVGCLPGDSKPSDQPVLPADPADPILQLAKDLVKREGSGIALLFDDLQHLSSEGFRQFSKLVEKLEEENPRGAVVVVATMNTYQEGAQDLSWLDTDAICSIHLDRLSASDITELLRALTGLSFQQSNLPQAIQKLTGGNVLFVRELLATLMRHLKQTEMTEHTFQSQLDRLAVPQELSAMLSLRLANLPADEKRLLEFLSVVDDGFSFHDLHQLMQHTGFYTSGVLPHTCDVVFQELLRKGILAEVIQGGKVTYSFAHHLFRKLIYQNLPAAIRTHFHHILANHLAAKQSCLSPTPHELSQIADHYFSMPEPQKAFAYAEQAARGFLFHSSIPSAIAYFEKALSLAPAPAQFELHLEIAPLCLKQGDLFDAERHYLAINQLSKGIDARTPARILALRKLGELYHLLMRPQQALQVLQEAEPLIAEAKSPLEALRVSWIRGRIWLRMGEYQRLFDESQNAIDQANQLGAHEELGELLYNRGIAQHFLNQPEQALADLQQSVTIFEDLRLPLKIAYALNGMGFVAHLQGELQKALEYYLRAYDFAVAENENRLIINFATNLAAAFHEMRDFKKAEAFYQKALTAAERGKQSGERAKILNNLGNLFLQFGHFTKAESMLRKCATICDEMDLAAESAATQVFLGDLFLEKEDWEGARRCFEKSLALATSMKLFQLQASARQGLAVIALAQKDLPRALAFLQEIEGMPGIFEFPAICLAQHRRWVEYFLEAGAISQAEIHLTEALALAQAETDPRKRWPIVCLQGECRQAVGDDREAIRCYSEAYRLVKEFALHIPEEYRHYFYALPKVARLRTKTRSAVLDNSG